VAVDDPARTRGGIYAFERDETAIGPRLISDKINSPIAVISPPALLPDRAAVSSKVLAQHLIITLRIKSRYSKIIVITHQERLMLPTN
jgi:hypothetical protein